MGYFCMRCGSPLYIIKRSGEFPIVNPDGFRRIPDPEDEEAMRTWENDESEWWGCSGDCAFNFIKTWTHWTVHHPFDSPCQRRNGKPIPNCARPPGDSWSMSYIK